MEILDNLKIYFYSNSYTGDWGEGDACISQSLIPNPQSLKPTNSVPHEYEKRYIAFN